ncbi:MAG TPA: helix-turn-helix transcriptional regulator [Cellvibrionaceae bacterium]
MFIDSEIVREVRQSRGWTQQQLAEVADLSLRTIQRVENQSVGSHETVASLCAVLHVDREQLLQPEKRHSQGSGLRVLVIPAAATLGAIIGSGLTLLFMQMG